MCQAVMPSRHWGSLGRAAWGSPSTAHLVRSTLPYFSRQSRWQWEDKEARQNRREGF